MTTLANSTRYRADIQGLRGIAVLVVVLYHAKIPFFTGGFVGVDVFFVISGYLITGILMREVEGTGRIDLLSFYARRIRRLLPAAVLVLVATGFVSAQWLSPVEQRELVWTFGTTALYVSNFWFAAAELDYLGPGLHENPLLHMWSLSVEEQFYLVWPALILICVMGLAHNPDKRRRVLALSAVLIVASFAACVALTQTAQPWAFFSSPTRAWQFAIGGVCYIASFNALEKSRGLAFAMPFGGLALIAAAVLYFDAETRFPGWTAMIPTLGAAFLLLGGKYGADGPNRFVAAAPLRWLGDRSYSWYLWHWPVQIFWQQWTQPSGLVSQLTPPAISLALAALTHVLVENRFRYSPLLAASERRTMVAAVAMTLVALTTALGLRVSVGVLASDERQQQVRIARRAIPDVYADGCHLSYLETEVEGCQYGDLDSSVEALLFGDSHAAHWFPAVAKLARQSGYKLTALSKSSCPPYVVSQSNSVLGRQYVECDTWRQNVLDLVREKQPRLVFISNFYGGWKLDEQREITADWKEGVVALFSDLSANSDHVFVLRDIAPAKLDMSVCVSRAAMRGEAFSACDFDEAGQRIAQVDAFLRAQTDRYRNIWWIDSGDMLCGDGVCRAVIGETLVYRDAHHLTVAMSEAMEPFLKNQITAVLRTDPTEESSEQAQ
ncbi:MAG: acyltransferase family protein [Pseudomonadota bacterium]